MDSEALAANALVGMAPRIKVWGQRVDEDPIAGGDLVSRGSELADDDNWLDNVMPMSTAVRMQINAAVDHLGGVVQMFELSDPGAKPTMSVRPYAHYPPIRAAMEAASTAIWLLEPSAADERRKRRLALHLSDGKYRHAALTLMAAESESRGFDDKEAQGLRAREEVRYKECRETVLAGMKELGRPSLSGLGKSSSLISRIRVAGGVVGSSEDRAQWIWNCLSAASHAEPWGAAALGEHEVIADLGDGQLIARHTASLLTVVGMLGEAYDSTSVAWKLWDQRRTPTTQSVSE